MYPPPLSSDEKINLIVMTDDHNELQKELKEFYEIGYGREKVNIFVFPTRISNGKYFSIFLLPFVLLL